MIWLLGSIAVGIIAINLSLLKVVHHLDEWYKHDKSFDDFHE